MNNRKVRRVYALRSWMLELAIALMDLRDPRTLQAATMVALAQNLLLRTAEITSPIRRGDVTWGRNMESVTIELQRTKTVRDAGGVAVNAVILDARYSGVRLLRLWWCRCNLSSASMDTLVFPGINAASGQLSGSPASGAFFREAIKRMVASIGLNPAHFSGHSARAGGATDLFAAGTPYPIVKAAGRWASDVACLYNRDDMEVAAAIARGFNKLCRSLDVPTLDIDTVLGLRL